MTKDSVRFRVLRNEDERSALLDWWRSLEEMKGDRAELRRCEGPAEVLLVPAYHRLAQRLPTLCKRDPVALAAVAGLLSHVREQEGPRKFAAQLGHPSPGGKAPMSALRFQQLQKAGDWNELYRRLRRAVDLLEKKANVLSLADDVLQWGWEYSEEGLVRPADSLRYRWAQEYFSEAIAAESKS